VGLVLALVIGTTVVSAAARRIGIPPPIALVAAAILGPDADDEHLPELVDGAVVAAASYTEARHELLRVERAETIRMWNRGEIGDQALAALQRRLDLEEQQIN
jgi:hypothetical protein